MRNQLISFLNSLPEIKGKRVYVWGTGNTLNFYRLGFSRIPDFKIYAYVDSNEEKQGKIIDDIKVIAPSDIQMSNDSVILICTPQHNVYDAIVRQINGQVLCAHIDAGIFSLYKNDVVKVFDFLEDEKSQKIYFELIKKRSLFEELNEDIYSESQYFSISSFIKRNINEIFIDCGAFVGDTIEQYIWNRSGVFNKIIAIEPDKVNFSAMEYRILRLKNEWGISDSRILKLPFAVSEKSTIYSVERMDDSGLGTRVTTNNLSESEKCQSITLNDYIDSEDCFIKADIEGFEYNMLLGAIDGIKKYNPKLAICIYHNAIDMFSLPLLIKEICPDYKLAVRHHSYSYDETVLYAYVEK